MDLEIKYNQVVGSWKRERTFSFCFPLINEHLHQVINSKSIYDDRWWSKKKYNMKVGITFSTFDLLHARHVKMLEEAKS